MLTMNASLRRANALHCSTACVGMLLLVLGAPGMLPAQSAADTGAVTIRSLGTLINTDGNEYAPSVTANGLTLYFVSDRPGGVGMHDFWYATKGSRLDTAFSEPVNLGPPINTSQSEGAGAIAADGQTIYFTACGRPDGAGDCDIYMARLEGNSWTNVRNLSEVNSPYWESQPAISSDGRRLYFVSTRPGSLGGAGDADIYVSERDNDGLWTTPVNLGAPINTPQLENSPFPLSGGNVLYFSSAGHAGLGGLDFFYSVKQSNGTWGEPVNLGAPLSTPGADRFLTLPASADVIYFASDRTDAPNAGRLDLFLGLLPPRTITALIHGRVFDQTSGNGVKATLTFIDSVSGDTLYNTATNQLTGDYAFVTNAGLATTIQVHGTSQGYGPVAGSIHVPEATQYIELRRDFPLASSSVDEERSAGVARRALAVFPNPASGDLTIDCSGLPMAVDVRDLVVVDSYGNEVLRRSFAGDRCVIDLRGLAAGIYLARVGTTTKAFVKMGERR
jgi:WD40-like Beta Propeller Repeat/Secretion system C-terminal sorting domain